MSFLNLDRFQATAVNNDPFDHVVVKGFVNDEALVRLNGAFPAISQGGSFPHESLECSETFRQFCDELQGPEIRAAFEEKFDIELDDHPTTLTVRGRCRQKDGKVHVDSKTKLITVLVYLNDSWESDGGRLRLLRSNDINDVAYEAPPEQGTLIAFRNGPTAWHGHLPFDGPRRVMQLNWVTDESAMRRSQRRHGLSAWFKKLTGRKQAA